MTTLTPHSGWQPIKTAPKNEYVLVYCPDAADFTRIMICGLLEFEGDPDPADWYELNADTRPAPLDVAPTHWMPLPHAPVSGGHRSWPHRTSRRWGEGMSAKYTPIIREIRDGKLFEPSENSGFVQTALPWVRKERDGVPEIHDAEGDLILGEASGYAFNLPEYEELAFNAVNVHDDLVKALELAREGIHSALGQVESARHIPDWDFLRHVRSKIDAALSRSAT